MPTTGVEKLREKALARWEGEGGVPGMAGPRASASPNSCAFTGFAEPIRR